MFFSSRSGSAALLLSGFLATASRAALTLTDEYTPANFYQEFDFFSSPDPTHGFVEYVNAKTANDNSLGGYYGQSVFLGPDYKTRSPPNGRRSTRVVSKKSWTHGLFIADIAHMPGSICGVWPAYWLVGPDWPAGGEIDIIEGVNNEESTSVTLHTSPGCTITNAGAAKDTKLNSPNCNESDGYVGCGQKTTGNQNYGDGFNSASGGVYATLWTSEHISTWFFPRTKIPADVASGNPDPASWGPPLARFNGGSGCDIDKHFHDHKIVINTTFCGDWAGGVWEQNKECSALAKTCEEYVTANPDAFAQAYWLVNKIQVFKEG